MPENGGHARAFWGSAFLIELPCKEWLDPDDTIVALRYGRSERGSSRPPVPESIHYAIFLAQNVNMLGTSPALGSLQGVVHGCVLDYQATRLRAPVIF